VLAPAAIFLQENSEAEFLFFLSPAPFFFQKRRLCSPLLNSSTEPFLFPSPMSPTAFFLSDSRFGARTPFFPLLIDDGKLFFLPSLRSGGCFLFSLDR